MPDEDFEDQISRIARHLRYPATPALTLHARQRRLRLSPLAATGAVILLVACIVMSPVAYAAVSEFFRVGSEEIQVSTAVLAPPTLPIPLRDLPGETTLAQAVAAFPYDLLIPANYPPPDHVYLLDQNAIVIMVWLDPADPDGIGLVLYQSTPEGFIFKVATHDLEEVMIHQESGWWSTGSQWVALQDVWQFRNPIVVAVDDHVLVWHHRYVTYRLEGDFTQAAAIALAESLQPVGN